MPDILENLRADELAQVEETTPDDQQQPEAAAEEATPAEQPHRWAGKYESPEALESAYSSVEHKMHEQAQENSQMRNRLAELEARVAPPQAQQPTPPQDTVSYAVQMTGMSREQLETLATYEPLKAQTIMAEAAAQKVAWEQAQKQEAMLAPLYAGYQQNATRAAIDNLTREFGEDAVQQHGQALYDYISKFPDMFVSDSQVNYPLLRSVMITAQHDGSARTAPRDDQGRFTARETHVEGGSTGHTPNGVQRTDPPIDPVIRELDEDRPERDRFGGTPFDLPLVRRTG